MITNTTAMRSQNLMVNGVERLACQQLRENNRGLWKKYAGVAYLCAQ